MIYRFIEIQYAHHCDNSLSEACGNRRCIIRTNFHRYNNTTFRLVLLSDCSICKYCHSVLTEIKKLQKKKKNENYD